MKLLKNILVSGLLLLVFASQGRAQIVADTTQHTLSLQEFLNRVGKSNPGFLAEKYKVSIAEAEVIAQKVFPDPNLDFEAADGAFSLGLGYTLEAGNKRGARVRLAKSQAELERLALEYFYQQLRADATLLYLEAMQQMELLNVKRSSFHYMTQLSHSDSIRFRAGEISEIDARQSKLEAVTLLNDVFEQEAYYKSALATLNQYMGSTSDTLSVPRGEWITPGKAFILPELIAVGLANRVEYVAADKSVEVAVNQNRLTKAERKIDLGLSVKYERDWRGFFPPPHSYTVGVSVPLKFSNLNKGAVKASRFAIEQAATEKQDVELQIQTEIAHAFFRFEAAGQKLGLYQSGLLDESQKILEGMVYQYQRGETSLMEVLIAQRTYNDIQEQYVETRKEYSSAFVELQRSCGTWNM